MARLTVRSESPEQTRRLGAALGRAARAGDVLLLDGPFGAGKTVLVQGLAHGLDVPTPVGSPSFIMVNEHRGRLPLYHVDLYRLETGLDPEMLDTLEELVDSGGVCAIEWPGALPPPLRTDATALRFVPSAGTTRDIEVDTSAAHLEAAARQVMSDA
jgi:tRNA threonylcarbamoyladenosine biosynthesis protein TsaE